MDSRNIVHEIGLILYACFHFYSPSGFPILFPETHMSMKRNTSAVESASTNKPTGKNNNSTETSSNSTSSSASDSSEETITTESMGKTPKVNGTNATSGIEIRPVCVFWSCILYSVSKIAVSARVKKIWSRGNRNFVRREKCVFLSCLRLLRLRTLPN